MIDRYRFHILYTHTHAQTHSEVARRYNKFNKIYFIVK